jgi:hypothetical protein
VIAVTVGVVRSEARVSFPPSLRAGAEGRDAGEPASAAASEALKGPIPPNRRPVTSDMKTAIARARRSSEWSMRDSRGQYAGKGPVTALDGIRSHTLPFRKGDQESGESGLYSGPMEGHVEDRPMPVTDVDIHRVGDHT